jgi:hypothetical protein
MMPEKKNTIELQDIEWQNLQHFFDILLKADNRLKKQNSTHHESSNTSKSLN